MLELDVRDAVVVQVVLRNIQQRERSGRIRVRVPRELQHAAVVQRHDADASELRRRDRRWSLTRGDGRRWDISARLRLCCWRLSGGIGSKYGCAYTSQGARQECSSMHADLG